MIEQEATIDKSEEKKHKAIKRIFLFFAILFVAYYSSHHVLRPLHLILIKLTNFMFKCTDKIVQIRLMMSPLRK